MPVNDEIHSIQIKRLDDGTGMDQSGRTWTSTATEQISESDVLFISSEINKFSVYRNLLIKALTLSF